MIVTQDNSTHRKGKRTMKIEYVFTASEIKAAKDRLAQLRQAALLSRDAKEMEDSKEFYFKAKGFEEALITLGIVQEVKR